MYSKNFEIGRRIKEEREEKRITQEQLAELSDLSPNYISKMENGTYTNIGSKHLIDICNALNITMGDLFQDNLNEQQRVNELPLNVQKLITSLIQLKPQKQRKIVDTVQLLVERLTNIVK